MAGPTISTLNKWAGELKQLVGAPPPSTSRCECSREHRLLQSVAKEGGKPSVVRQRLYEQLRAALRQLRGSCPAPMSQVAARHRKQADRFAPAVEPNAAPDPMQWVLIEHTSEAASAALDGPPVHLRYRERRSPSGFRDALSFLRQLGDGGHCVFKRRRKSMLERPQEVQLLASRRSGSRVANPISQPWRNITANPSVACSQGAYVKIYYGGDAAARLQKRVRARLPANLCLRGHRRSLMFFVSISESNSTTHFDRTPSVLVCLCGTRTVWLAPPEVKARCGLRHRAGYPHLLSYDPSACEPELVWKRVVLRAGQGVFIPAGWWHCVLASAGSIGVSLEVTDV
jgi:hypothetical protein